MPNIKSIAQNSHTISMLVFIASFFSGALIIDNELDLKAERILSASVSLLMVLTTVMYLKFQNKQMN